jgi:hypothetical protein
MWTLTRPFFSGIRHVRSLRLRTLFDLLRSHAMVLAFSPGLPSFLGGFRKHKKWRALAAGFAGIGVILGALAFGDRFHSHVAEIKVTSVGSLLLTTAHLMNRTFCRRCGHCEH